MVLNHINQRKHNNEVQFHVPEEGRTDKPCKAIKIAAEKIIILVRPARKARISSSSCCSRGGLLTDDLWRTGPVMASPSETHEFT